MPAGRMNKFSDGLSGVGIDGGTSAWASDRSEGHISRYLSETRTYMLAQAAEVENLLKVTQGAAKFESLSNKLALLDQYIRAVSLIEQVERGRDNRMHEMGNFRWHAQEEALEAVRDILIVSHIKMRSKWSAAEGLSAAVARETLSCMRLRMGQLLKVLAPDAVPRLQPLVQETYHSSSVTSNYNVECRRRYSARSLVVVTEDFTSDAAAIQMLIPPHPEPWKSFGDITGESLTMRTATASPTIEQTTAVSSSSSATSALDKFAECRKLVEKLSTHQSLNQIVLSRHLKSLEALVDSGYQTVLFANNACPVLVSIAEHNLNSFPICHLICSVLEKLCLLNAPCAHSLIDLNIWRLLSLLFAKRSNEAEFCIVGSRLMTAILTSAEENKKASFAAIESSSLFMMLKPVIRIHQVDFHTCQPLIQAIVHAVDKSYTAESSFMRSGLCEALISCIHQFGAFPGMKMQFVVLVSRLASGNKYMQDLLISMHVFEAIIDIISEYTLSDPMLIKSTCFAISSLVSRHHSGQTKFASAGGCKALCSTLRLNQDLHTLTYILRAMAALAQQNAYVQDVFQLESAAELLQAKREEISALSERSPSFETKSKLNLLLLTCEYALDAVRSPPVGRRPVLSTEYTGLPFADLPGISGRYGGGGSGDGGEDDALRRSRGLSLRMGLGLGLADGEPTGVGVDGDERASGETPDWLI